MASSTRALESAAARYSTLDPQVKPKWQESAIAAGPQELRVGTLSQHTLRTTWHHSVLSTLYQGWDASYLDEMTGEF